MVEADIERPTDASLLHKAVRKLGQVVRRIKTRGAARRTPYRDRTRSAGRRIRAISQSFRRRTGDARVEVDRLTAELAELARRSLRQAERVLGSARRALAHRPRDGRLGHLVRVLQETTEGTRRLVDQTRQRLGGERSMSIPNRMVSLADPEARPIRRGKPHRLTEFGYKVLLAESEEGFLVGSQTHLGNPADAHLMVPAVRQVASRLGRPPHTVVGDRGFGTAPVERDLLDLGVRRVGIPRQGRPSRARAEYEKGRSFRRLRRWRVGIEARISHLNREVGLSRTRLRTKEGATIWTESGIFAHNLHRMAVLAGG